jgi:hypothetical protein
MSEMGKKLLYMFLRALNYRNMLLKGGGGGDRGGEDMLSNLRQD